MSLLFNKRDNSGPFPEPIVPPFPNAFGGTTGDSAMQLDAVWACVRLLSETVSMLPLMPLDVKNGVEIPLPFNKWPKLLVSPAPGLTMSDWLQQMMVSLLLRGNAYASWSGDARSGGQLIPLNPDLVYVRTEQGKKVISVNGVVQDNVFHIPGMSMPGAVKGMSPISYNATMLQTYGLIDDFARGYFSDAPHPASVLTSDKPINQEQAKQIKDRVIAAVSGREPLVLGLGLGMNALSITPEESQFLATQRAGKARVASIFGVPVEMIGGSTEGSAVTYANVTARSLDFLTYSVQRWLTRFEQAISVILPNQQHTRFDTNALIRMTPQDKAVADNLRIKNGSQYINAVRADYGEEPVDWGNEPYLPGMSMSAAGQAVVAEAAGKDEEV